MFGHASTRTATLVATCTLAAALATTAIAAQPASAQPKTTTLTTVTLGSLQSVCAGHGGQYTHGSDSFGPWGVCLLPGGQTIYCNSATCVFVSASVTSGGSEVKAPAPIGNRPVTLR